MVARRVARRQRAALPAGIRTVQRDATERRKGGKIQYDNKEIGNQIKPKHVYMRSCPKIVFLFVFRAGFPFSFDELRHPDIRSKSKSEINVCFL